MLISSKSYIVSIGFFEEIDLREETETYEFEFSHLMNDLACQANDFIHFEFSLQSEQKSDLILLNINKNKYPKNYDRWNQVKVCFKVDGLKYKVRKIDELFDIRKI